MQISLRLPRWLLIVALVASLGGWYGWHKLVPDVPIYTDERWQDVDVDRAWVDDSGKTLGTYSSFGYRSIIAADLLADYTRWTLLEPGWELDFKTCDSVAHSLDTQYLQFHRTDWRGVKQLLVVTTGRYFESTSVTVDFTQIEEPAVIRAHKARLRPYLEDYEVCRVRDDGRAVDRVTPDDL